MTARERRNHTERKEAAEKATIWLQPVASRAEAESLKDVTIALADLKDLLAYTNSRREKDENAMRGKKLGFARPQDMHEVLSGRQSGMVIKRVKGSKFTCEIYFNEIPGIPDQVLQES